MRRRFEMDVALLRNDAGEVIGFEVVAQPHTESEAFCSKFPGTLLAKKGSISFEGSVLVLSDPDEGECALALSDDAATLLKNAAQKHRGSFTLKKAGFMTQGFMMVAPYDGKISKEPLSVTSVR